MKKNETFARYRCIIRWEGIWTLRKTEYFYSMKKIPTNTITRDLNELAAPTGNIYETVVILSKRANQISTAEKKELTKKLEDFKNDRDTMEEVFENREQIEISKYYERQPKPSLVAISEFEDNEIYYRMAKKEEDSEE